MRIKGKEYEVTGVRTAAEIEAGTGSRARLIAAIMAKFGISCEFSLRRNGRQYHALGYNDGTCSQAMLDR